MNKKITIADATMVQPMIDYFELFSLAPAFIAILQGKNHTFTFANKPYYQLVGFRDILGKTVAEVIPEVVEQGFIKILDAVFRTGKPYTGKEIKINLQVKKNAQVTERYLDFVYQPIKNNAGEIIGIFVHGFDVTEQVHAREKVEESKKNFEFLANASKILASSLDYQDILRHIAKLSVPYLADFCVFDVITEDHIIQRVTWEHVDKKLTKYIKQVEKFTPNIDYIHNPVAKSLKVGKATFLPHVDDAWMQKASTSPEHLAFQRTLGYTSVIAVPITSRGKVSGNLTFIYTKASHRQYTEADLRTAEEIAARAALAIENAKLYQSAQENEIKFKALSDSNIIGVFIADKKGTILEANDGYLRIIGYTRDDLKKRLLNRLTLTPKEYKKIYQGAMQELKQTGKTSPWEKEYIRKDGSQIPVIVGTSIINPLKGDTINIVLDITEQKRLEQRKDEFIGVASHELKTPLTSIKAYVQILERIIEEIGDTKAKMLVSKTNTYINRLNSLITDLLDVSKIQAGKLIFNMEDFDMYDLIRAGIEAMQPISLKHHIIWEDPIHQKIRGDKDRLEQVFTNLVSNAIKYSPHGEKIIIRMTKKYNRLTVSIQDFGIGIHESQHDKLFERFYRVQKSAAQFSGLGIGLYISNEIITRHRGTMWVESTEGKGSTFFFSLPYIDNTI